MLAVDPVLAARLRAGPRRDHPAGPGHLVHRGPVGLVGHGDEGGILEDLAVEAELPAGEARVAEAGRVLGVAKGAVQHRQPVGARGEDDGRRAPAPSASGGGPAGGTRSSPRERSPSPTVMPASRGVAAAISWARASPRGVSIIAQSRSVGGAPWAARSASASRTASGVSVFASTTPWSGTRASVARSSRPHGVSRPLTVTRRSCRRKPPVASVAGHALGAPSPCRPAARSPRSRREARPDGIVGADSYAPGSTPSRYSTLRRGRGAGSSGGGTRATRPGGSRERARADRRDASRPPRTGGQP